MAAALATALEGELAALARLSPAQLQQQRAERFLRIGEG